MNRTATRREKLLANARADEVDAILVSSPTNVRYLTGFTGEASALLLTKDRTLLLSDGRFTTQIREDCPEIEAEIRAVDQTLNQSIAATVGKLGIGRLGFESVHMTVADHLDLVERLPSVAMKGTRNRVEALRAIKDDDEVNAIREAIEFAERAFAMLRGNLRRGATEKETADDLEAYLRRCGATAASFPPIVAVGRRSALPHAQPSIESRIGDADFVLVDWGAAGRPYKSDLTRVLVTGKFSPQFEKVYRTVLSAQERGIAAIRPGATGRDVDAEARSVIEEAGFGAFFDHGLGHGLGMDIHEDPRIRKGSDVVLQPGMVVTVEPGIYLPEWGGIRIEDDVLVTPDGREVLSHVPKALESLSVS